MSIRNGTSNQCAKILKQEWHIETWNCTKRMKKRKGNLVCFLGYALAQTFFYSISIFYPNLRLHIDIQFTQNLPFKPWRNLLFKVSWTDIVFSFCTKGHQFHTLLPVFLKFIAWTCLKEIAVLLYRYTNGYLIIKMNGLYIKYTIPFNDKTIECNIFQIPTCTVDPFHLGN